MSTVVVMRQAPRTKIELFQARIDAAQIQVVELRRNGEGFRASCAELAIKNYQAAIDKELGKRR